MSDFQSLIGPTEAMDPNALPDDRLFTMFLDWASNRGLIVGYYLILFHQTGLMQGVPSTFEKLPDSLDIETRSIVESFVSDYKNRKFVPQHEFVTTSGGLRIHRTSISRIYDIDLGALIFITHFDVSKQEVDGFISFMETTVSIRKQAIASLLNPPFVDLALDGQVKLDFEVGETVLRSIEANQTHVLRFDGEEYHVVYSTTKQDWIVEASDPLIRMLAHAKDPIHFQDIHLVAAGDQRSDMRSSQLVKLIRGTGCRSVLLFLIEHKADKFAVAVCLFKRPHAVSMTEVTIAKRLRSLLSDYYRLGHERHRSYQASIEAEEVERKARQALLIADIMHDATDDLIELRSNIEGLRPRNDSEANDLENAKKNLKRLQASTKLFHFLFNPHEQTSISVEKAMAAGKDYYGTLQIRDMFESLINKYERSLSDAKITEIIQVPPMLALRCMEVSITRAIDNLIKNSIRHLKTKTHVKRTLTLGARETLFSGVKVVEIWVRDNGPGIEEAIIPKIHRPFVSFSGGMGLGLAIVTTVCDIHGGKFIVESRWGQWTQMTLRIPQPTSRARGN